MKFKFIGSWSDKFIGFKLNDYVYYIAWRDKDCNLWGYRRTWYDGEMYEFGIGRFALLWHWD